MYNETRGLVNKTVMFTLGMMVMEIEASSLKELENSIQIVKQNIEVSLVVTSGKCEYPYMNLLIQDDRAYVHYFSSDDEAGFQSIGESESDEIVTINASQEYYVPEHTLVSLDSALFAAKEFIQTKALPKCIEWYEL
jgi:hypothetical protein